MASLTQLRERFKLLKDRQYFIPDSIEATQKEIIEYQKGQMLRGINSLGGKIGKYRNDDYARKKYNMNPLAGYKNVDLKLTGEYQRNTHIRFFSKSFVLFSTDFKYEKLNEMYDNIWGLSPDFRAEYSALYLKAEANKRIIKHLHGL